MTTFKRGFKSWSERLSADVRKDLGLKPEDPIAPLDLAALLEIQVFTPRDFELPKAVLTQLLQNDRSGWSAVSLEPQPGKFLIIYNPTNSRGRQASDIMHEIAHIILNHQPATIILSPDGSFLMRSFDKKQEDEANWLAFCLLLPRPALLASQYGRLTVEEIADGYGVSKVLVNFRLRMSGVLAQVHAAQKLRHRKRFSGV